MTAPRSITDHHRRGVAIGAPLGYILNAAFFGGLGYWCLATPGAIAGIAIALVISTAGLLLAVRYVNAFAQLEAAFDA